MPGCNKPATDVLALIDFDSYNDGDDNNNTVLDIPSDREWSLCKKHCIQWSGLIPLLIINSNAKIEIDGFEVERDRES